MEGIAGKVVFITGGASGIGRECAQRFLQCGAKAVVADLNPEGETVLSGFDRNGLFLQHDVASEESWTRNLAATVEAFGSLDVLINSAGIVIPGTPVNTSVNDWRRMFEVNVDGTFLGCKHAIPLLSEGRGGVIINLGSIGSFTPSGAVFGYGVTKAAVKLLSRSVASYCRKEGLNVRCNTVFPGPILTPMTNAVLDRTLGEGSHKQFHAGETSPFGTLGDAADIAEGILYLASDGARYANGAELVLDGGTTL
jgi:3(or 17)beta-hydroxysteroid dehydrogenase